MNHHPSSREAGLAEYQRLLALLDERRFDEAQVRGRVLLESPEASSLVRAKTHNLMCWTFAEGYKRVTPEAILHGEEAVRLADSIGQWGLKAQALCNLASAYFQIGDWDLSRKSYQETRALAHADPAAIPQGEALALLGLAQVDIAEGDPTAALAHLDQAEALCDTEEARFLQGDIHRRRALAYVKLKQPETAAKALARIEETAQAQGPRTLWWKTHLGFTRALVELTYDHWVTARTMATNTLALARELGDFPVIAEANCILAVLDHAEGRREAHRRARLALTCAIQSGRRDVVQEVRERLGELLNSGI